MSFGFFQILKLRKYNSFYSRVDYTAAYTGVDPHTKEVNSSMHSESSKCSHLWHLQDMMHLYASDSLQQVQQD